MKIKSGKVISIMLALGFVSNSNLALSNPLDLQKELKTCALISQNTARLLCFDDLATNSQTTKLIAQNKANAKPEAGRGLPQNIGGGKFESSSKKEQVNFGKVIACSLGRDRKWLFEFESGQIWKQVHVDNVARRYKNCNMSVSIRKDGFGYKMVIDKLSRKMRVKRIK